MEIVGKKSVKGFEEKFVLKVSVVIKIALKIDCWELSCMFIYVSFAAQ